MASAYASHGVDATCATAASMIAGPHAAVVRLRERMEKRQTVGATREPAALRAHAKLRTQSAASLTETKTVTRQPTALAISAPVAAQTASSTPFRASSPTATITTPEAFRKTRTGTTTTRSTTVVASSRASRASSTSAARRLAAQTVYAFRRTVLSLRRIAAARRRSVKSTQFARAAARAASDRSVIHFAVTRSERYVTRLPLS